MRLPMLFCLPIAVAACSEAREPSPIESALATCKHLREPQKEPKKFEVGISDYEACLGERANGTHPANQRLCNLAKSTMSASGTCILGE